MVVSGFSGVGKGTLMKCLTGRHSEYALSISATTRAPREGEEDGREYFFRTKEEFEDLIARDRLIEYACYCGNYYGTPRDYVEEQMACGRDVILEIELQALEIRRQYPDALLLFVMPPDVRTLLTRLQGRGTESGDVIRARLHRAVEESAEVEKYDYIVVNDDLEQSAEEVHRLIVSQHSRVEHNAELIGEIRSELRLLAEETGA